MELLSLMVLTQLISVRGGDPQRREPGVLPRRFLGGWLIVLRDGEEEVLVGKPVGDGPRRLPPDL